METKLLLRTLVCWYTPVEEQEEVLERLGYEKAVHPVFRLAGAHVAHAGIAARHPTVRLQRPEKALARPQVLGRTRRAVQGERALRHFRPEGAISAVVQQPAI